MSNTYPPSDPRDESPLFTDTARDTSTTGAGATHHPVITPPSGPRTDEGSSSDGAGGRADHAKQAAAEVGHTAKEAGADVAGTAKDEATKVASEAKAQAKDLFEQSRGELTEQAATQQKRVAQGLRSIGEELEGMSSGSEGSGVATQFVGQAADRLQGVAGWLDDRDPGSLLSEVKQFAARRPGVFIGVAAAAGLLAGRLTKGLLAEAKDDTESEASPVGTSTPASASFAAAPATPTAVPTETGLEDDLLVDDVDGSLPTSTDPLVDGDGTIAERGTFPGGLR